MSSKRYLTKSRFKLGCECPTKLFYTGKKEKYTNNSLDNEFLQALAEGGYQVGELAKEYFAGGYDIETLDYDEALELTNDYLKQDNIILYEPAFLFNNLFVRVDILVKKGNLIYLYEVKAKSFDIHDEKNKFFNTKKNEIKSGWKPYIYDISFQNYVVSNAMPGFTIIPHLTLADKTATCHVNGLNQKFPISKDTSGRIKVQAENLTEDDLKHKLLVNVSVIDEINFVYENVIFEDTGFSFFEQINFLSNMYLKDEKITPVLKARCKDCEFVSGDNHTKSGFHECWKESLGWCDKEFEKPLVFELWNYRKKNALIEDGRYLLEEMCEDDFKDLDSNDEKLTQQQRQYLQIEKVQNNDDSIYLNKEGLLKEMETWVYPLHCIDFETMTNAIPFNKGLHPYESVAFQFSHHIIYEDGRIEHKGEYINTKQGEFPNFEFARALKKELEHDNGTIFRYSPHENTILNHIYRQLESSNESDKKELQEFILEITYNRDDKHVGSRNMVDLLELVKWYYYDPQTKGSNSIKYVLPAIMNRSAYLQDKYSKSIYGTNTMPSKNFTNFAWIEKDENGTIKDPYKLLPKIFEDVETEDEQKLLSENEELKNGAAAMTAYAKMQFTHMSDTEKDALKNALLKYCELDTLAMVFILEDWINLLKKENVCKQI